MAHASKSFVVFTGGEWSEQLHGRTDLAKADSAGRKVRNFVPAQTGRLSRRKGLEFVGAALGECLAGDPRFMVPEWGSLDEEATIDPTIDVYGSLGPEELRTSENVGPIWQVCANIQYCYGPTEEGATMQDKSDRYQTRWVAKLEDGKVYYRRVGTGEDWAQVSNDLIPQPDDTLNGIGFCFDANARPCFASAIGDNIHIWRWVASTPTEYTFPGQGPRLFFNGVLQPENTAWDVVCYFCWNGDFIAAFQRENFATNYTLFTHEDYYLTRVRVVERGLEPEDKERLFWAVTGNSGVYGLFRSGLYPLWAIGEDSSCSALLGIDTDGDYELVAILAGEFESPMTATLSLDDGDYIPTVLTTQAEEEMTSLLGLSTDGQYELVVVVAEPESSAVNAGIVMLLTGDYVLVVVVGGTYTDSVTATLGLSTDGEYSL